MNKARDRWLKRRQNGIGASEVAMLVGLSRWGGPLTLWARKLGLAPPVEETEWMEAGNVLEPAIVSWFKRQTGFDLENPGRYRMWWHPNGIQFATPDRLIPSSDATRARGLTGPGVLDVKNTAEWMAYEWDEEAPIAYRVQLQQQMDCAGTDWGAVCALIGGNKLRWKVYLRDPSIQKPLRHAAAHFWSTYVETKTQPPADVVTRLDLEAVKYLHPDDNGDTVQLAGSFIDVDGELDQLNKDTAQVKRRIDTLKAQLRAAIGGNTYGAIPGGVVYSLKTNARGVRTLRRKKSNDHV